MLYNLFCFISLRKNHPIPTFLKTAVIKKLVPALFETDDIGNPITVAQNQRFINRCNRRPIEAISKNAGIGSPIAAFYSRRYRLDLSSFFLLI